jgi:DHA1 family multidrug resistance protein-like MFS transporter
MLGPVSYGYLSGWFGIRGTFIITTLMLVVTAIWLKVGLNIKPLEIRQTERKTLKNPA